MDCIAAIATPLAPSAIGILRLSGDGAAAVAGRVFHPANGRDFAEHSPRTMVYGAVETPEGTLLDHGLGVWFSAAHSYTGEEAVELYLHGSPVVLGETLSLLLSSGARQAGPGEFTRRAFLSGRMDLTQAEAVMDLIDAETAEAARLAAAQEGGALRRKVEGIYEGLLEVASRFYAVVDYPDEDLEDVSPEELKGDLAVWQRDLEALVSTARRGRILKSGLPAVLLGKPNVGKSSLLNALTGTDRCLVTATAGTTRDTVEEKVRLGGVVLRLTDTAGIRQTADEIEAMGVERTLRAADQAELALVVIDGSRPLTAEDEEAFAAASGCKKVLVVRNKADLPVCPAVSERFPEAVPVSARTGEGLEELEQAVAALYPAGEAPAGCLLANARQEDAARRALGAVERARAAFAGGLTPDAVLSDVEDAMNALGELTGRTAKEDIVSAIFSRFCVGK